MKITMTLAAMMLSPLACLAQATNPGANAGTTPGIDAGKQAYMVAGCYQCHGTVGQGGVGPRLAPKPMPVQAMTAFVRAAPRTMPPYDTKVLSDRDMNLIHAYLSSIEASPTVEQIPQLR